MDIFKNKTILITGGTGSFGKACVKKILADHQPKSVRIYSRDELKQWEMRRELDDSPKLRFLIGDIRDGHRLSRAMEGVDYVIHAAALKQVPACEYNPFEAVRTNVEGGMSVINAALDNNVRKVIALSTDKAANPVNTYGATKLCSDRLFIQSNSYRGPHRETKLSVVRYGNVMGSRGSVIPLFRHQKEKGVLTITDERMTRFWITLPQAVDFVLSSLGIMQGGELFIPKIPSMKLTDLASIIAPEAKKKIIGIRPGEKIHEYLITIEEGRLAYELKDRYIIFSDAQEGWKNDLTKYKGMKRVKEHFEYNSLNNPLYLSADEMKGVLVKHNLL